MTNPPTGDLFGGADALPIELEAHEAAAGVDKTVALPGGRTFTIRIPPGVTDNMVLRLPGADTSDPSGPKDIFLRVLLKPPAPAAPFGMPVAPPPWAPPGAPTSGMPASAPPMSAPPMSAPPMSAPPMSAPPMSGPPMTGPPTSGAGFPATSGAGFPPTSGAGFPPVGPGYPAPGAGFPPGGEGYPTSGAGFPATGVPGAPGAWPPGPVVPPPKSNGKVIGLVAGAVVLVLVLCGGGAYLATSGNSKNNKASADATATGTATKGATSSPTPAKPPVSPEEYTQILAAVDAAVTPAMQKVGAGRNPTDLGAAIDGLHTTTMEQLSTLDKTSPPELVKQAHNDLVSALGAWASTLDEASSAVKNSEVCAGATAMARITSASSANMIRTALQSYAKLDPGHAYKVGTFLPAASAEQNRRLGNGTFVKKGNRNGSGKLKIDNTGGATDAAISVVPSNTKASAFTVYVTAGQTYTVSGVRDGAYQVYLTSGADWDGGINGFSRTCAFKKFADTFDFKTTSTQYTQWTITLQTSVGGNARTDEVNPGDFPT